MTVGMDFETIKGLWRSWALLVGGTIALSALWLLPAEWVPDPDVAEVYAEYRGFIGFAALCFMTFTGARVIVEICSLTGKWLSSIPERRERKERSRANEDYIIRHVRTFSDQEKQLLRLCLRQGNPEIVVDPGDRRAKKLLNAGLLAEIECESFDRKHKFRIRPWVWKRLRRSHGRILNEADRSESDR